LIAIFAFAAFAGCCRAPFSLICRRRAAHRSRCRVFAATLRASDAVISSTADTMPPQRSLYHDLLFFPTPACSPTPSSSATAGRAACRQSLSPPFHEVDFEASSAFALLLQADVAAIRLFLSLVVLLTRQLRLRRC